MEALVRDNGADCHADVKPSSAPHQHRQPCPATALRPPRMGCAQAMGASRRGRPSQHQDQPTTSLTSGTKAPQPAAHPAHWTPPAPSLEGVFHVPATLLASHTTLTHTSKHSTSSSDQEYRPQVCANRADRQAAQEKPRMACRLGSSQLAPLGRGLKIRRKRAELPHSLTPAQYSLAGANTECSMLPRPSSRLVLLSPPLTCSVLLHWRAGPQPVWPSLAVGGIRDSPGLNYMAHVHIPGFKARHYLALADSHTGSLHVSMHPPVRTPVSMHPPVTGSHTGRHTGSGAVPSNGHSAGGGSVEAMGDCGERERALTLHWGQTSNCTAPGRRSAGAWGGCGRGSRAVPSCGHRAGRGSAGPRDSWGLRLAHLLPRVRVESRGEGACRLRPAPATCPRRTGSPARTGATACRGHGLLSPPALGTPAHLLILLSRQVPAGVPGHAPALDAPEVVTVLPPGLQCKAHRMGEALRRPGGSTRGLGWSDHLWQHPFHVADADCHVPVALPCSSESGWRVVLLGRLSGTIQACGHCDKCLWTPLAPGLSGLAAIAWDRGTLADAGIACCHGTPCHGAVLSPLY
ncbi:hypothetical protein HaLaN_03568 [Haematococcus lacustris]|uniref:Uncharacterized protein n=1 Tax=Haematococcus lacustris TaxID=44745 RepID=A0A699YEV3_HAELA|nr:hypothetical protein HaLaN_03568 [Haematococcus lacustris]